MANRRVLKTSTTDHVDDVSMVDENKVSSHAITQLVYSLYKKMITSCTKSLLQ